MKSSEIEAWFRGRISDDWFSDVEVVVDKDEILILGTLVPPTPASTEADEDHGNGERDEDAERRIAASARINGFREDTRAHRIKIATEAEHLFGRKVSWGACCNGLERRFTVANVPVMTRLQMDQRQVLDTLIEAGIARSRSEALAWCVKLVRDNQAAWIDSLRDALDAVKRARSAGPNVDE